MKLSLIFFFVLLAYTTLNAQATTSNDSVNYAVVVSFGSMCCGTASDDFLKDFIKEFNRKNKVIINVWQMSGCGREGEYKILFSLDKLKVTKKTKLIAALKKLIPKQNEKNKAEKASSGLISLDYNLTANKLENCRGQLTKWILTK